MKLGNLIQVRLNFVQHFMMLRKQNFNLKIRIIFESVSSNRDLHIDAIDGDQLL